MDAQAVDLDIEACLLAVFHDDVVVDGAGIEVLVERCRNVVFHGPEEGSAQILIYPIRVLAHNSGQMENLLAQISVSFDLNLRPS